ALLLAVAAFASTAYLLTPSFPETTYFGQWTPNLGHLARYRGRVLMATVGRVEIRPRRVQDSDGLRTSLLLGDTVEVWALAGPPVNRLASLFSIYDEFQREIFLVGPDGKDFALRYRTRAADYRLDRPHLRIEQRGDLSPGDSLFVRTWNSTTGRCLQLGAKTKCGIGYTVGSGWSLLFYAESFPRWLKRVLDVGWVAGLFLLVGFWTRTGVTGGTALLVAGLGLVIVPVASPLVMTPLTEWIGAGLGLAGGVALQRAGRPANHSRSTSPTP
ncbi:MAG: hypothetical protein OER90_03900, partial [Gemmatimonadota bacterium]|nr:hypothetical protein [Gemmatimonadota bacterium]